MSWLVDTNVLSELRRHRPESRVVDFISNCPINDLYVSTVTFAEIRFGIDRVEDPARRIELVDWMTLIVRPMFESRVLQITEDIMLRWRHLVERGRKTGHTFAQPDLIIAATAIHHQMTVVTRDRSEFDHAGAPVFDPWNMNL